MVTYNSNIQELKTNILNIKSQVNVLLVFDNHSSNAHSIEVLCNDLGVEFIKNNENIGLGAAYNHVLKLYQHKLEYFITLDQDTLFPEHAITKLLDLFSEKTVGIVGPSYTRKSISSQKSPISKVSYLIQSGSIFKAELFSTVGYFNEKLFIDSVDFEYCLRTLSAGYSIVRSNTIVTSHTIGISKQKFGINYTEHNALRNYYIARNHKYITLRFIKQYPFFLLKKNFFFMLHIIKLVLLDRDTKKIKNLIQGLKDNVNSLSE